MLSVEYIENTKIENIKTGAVHKGREISYQDFTCLK